MANRNHKGGKGYSMKPRLRKLAKFNGRYFMTPSQWAEYKKTNPQEAHQLYMAKNKC
jgi:hypothetical protein